MKKLALSLFLALMLPSALTLFPGSPSLALALASAEPPRYAVAIGATPVLNTPDFTEVFGGTLKLDPCRGVRPIEFTALVGTLFRIEREQSAGGVLVYRVTSNDYPYPTQSGYFVDARFLKSVDGAPRERLPVLPERGEVQRRLLSAMGKPYVWGGNFKDGVPLIRELYPQAGPLVGVDCSGLLYQATDGFTPRNTSALTSFGSAVKVVGLSPERIADKLQPLDLIVWKGHVMIVLDRDSIIQSVMGCGGGGGVRMGPRLGVIRNLMKSRQPLDDYPKGPAGAKGFVVRRWFPR